MSNSMWNFQVKMRAIVKRREISKNWNFFYFPIFFSFWEKFTKMKNRTIEKFRKFLKYLYPFLFDHSILLTYFNTAENNSEGAVNYFLTYWFTSFFCEIPSNTWKTRANRPLLLFEIFFCTLRKNSKVEKINFSQFFSKFSKW